MPTSHAVPAYRRLDLPSESRIAATRHAIDQVEGNPGKAGLGQDLDRPNRLRTAMPTPHKGQSRVVERLHTYRKPVDPHRAPLPGFLFGNVFGVGLQGDLRLGRKGKTTGGPFEQESDVSRRKQRRRPSAEINSTQLAVFPAGRAKGKFGRHRLDHARAGTKVGYGKEIAIHAFAPAKRDMEIDTAHGDAALKKREKGSLEGIFGYDEKDPRGIRAEGGSFRPSAGAPLTRRVLGGLPKDTAFYSCVFFWKLFQPCALRSISLPSRSTRRQGEPGAVMCPTGVRLGLPLILS